MALTLKNRALEWWLATTTFGFGGFLGQREVVMDTAPYRQLILWLPENAWAGFFLITGTLHLVALATNGRAQWMPLLRAGMAAANAAVFCLFAAGFFMVWPHTTSVYSYSSFAVAGFVCFYRAMKEWVACLCRTDCSPLNN
ncbi:MAG: hypothetical protein ACU0B9_07365 [Limimaricola soesokkakensis]|uniref:hypothetical protein n=1 Tax=Limimaricola soesokkakensis TaxID=1343159 RepID=UPI004059E644